MSFLKFMFIAEKIMVEIAFELYLEGWKEFHSLEGLEAELATCGPFLAPLFPHRSRPIAQVLSPIIPPGLLQALRES